MAIKPTDHIVYTRNLIVKYNRNELYIEPVYVDFWQNLLDHSQKISDKYYFESIKEVNKELAKFGGRYNHKKEYIKFSSKADYTWFVMTWQWKN